VCTLSSSTSKRVWTPTVRGLAEMIKKGQGRPPLSPLSGMGPAGPSPWPHPPAAQRHRCQGQPPYAHGAWQVASHTAFTESSTTRAYVSAQDGFRGGLASPLLFYVLDLCTAEHPPSTAERPHQRCAQPPPGACTPSSPTQGRVQSCTGGRQDRRITICGTQSCGTQSCFRRLPTFTGATF
jgi:hypothetical protein